jgi:hypothetical protein
MNNKKQHSFKKKKNPIFEPVAPRSLSRLRFALGSYMPIASGQLVVRTTSGLKSQFCILVICVQSVVQTVMMCLRIPRGTRVSGRSSRSIALCHAGSFPPGCAALAGRRVCAVAAVYCCFRPNAFQEPLGISKVQVDGATGPSDQGATCLPARLPICPPTIHPRYSTDMGSLPCAHVPLI